MKNLVLWELPKVLQVLLIIPVIIGAMVLHLFIQKKMSERVRIEKLKEWMLDIVLLVPENGEKDMDWSVAGMSQVMGRFLGRRNEIIMDEY